MIIVRSRYRAFWLPYRNLLTATPVGHTDKYYLVLGLQNAGNVMVFVFFCNATCYRETRSIKYTLAWILYLSLLLTGNAGNPHLVWGMRVVHLRKFVMSDICIYTNKPTTAEMMNALATNSSGGTPPNGVIESLFCCRMVH